MNDVTKVSNSFLKESWIHGGYKSSSVMWEATKELRLRTSLKSNSIIRECCKSLRFRCFLHAPYSLSSAPSPMSVE